MSRSIAALPQEGDVINGSYRLGRELGRGSFGVVFEAEEVRLRRRVALKIMLPRALAQAEVAERFKREALLASALTSPHVATVYAFGVWGEASGVQGLPYMAMERLEGEDLYYVLARRERLTPQEALAILHQGSSALAEAHRRGIIHRDLKPENVFIAWAGDRYHVKILDFGIAHAIRGSWGSESLRRLTAVGMVCGTPEFMAPEQASGVAELTPAVDVYALGCLAYQMLTGALPYSGASPMDVALQHISAPPPQLPPELGAGPLGELLRASLAKRPEERLPDAGAFQRAVEACAEQLGVGLELGGLGLESPGGGGRGEEALEDTFPTQESRTPGASRLPPEAALPTRVDPRASLPELPAPYVATTIQRAPTARRPVAWWGLGGLGLLGLLGAAWGLLGADASLPSDGEAPSGVVLDSVPSGAEVRQGERALGLTPLEVPCDAGSLELRRAGFEPLLITPACAPGAQRHRTLPLAPAAASAAPAPASAAPAVRVAAPPSAPPSAPATAPRPVVPVRRSGGGGAAGPSSAPAPVELW